MKNLALPMIPPLSRLPRPLPWPVRLALVDLGLVMVLILAGCLVGIASLWEGLWTPEGLAQFEQIQRYAGTGGYLMSAVLLLLQLPLGLRVRRATMRAGLAPARIDLPRITTLLLLIGFWLAVVGFSVTISNFFHNQAAGETLDHYYRQQDLLNVRGFSLIFVGPLIAYLGVLIYTLQRWWGVQRAP